MESEYYLIPAKLIDEIKEMNQGLKLSLSKYSKVNLSPTATKKAAEDSFWNTEVDKVHMYIYVGGYENAIIELLEEAK